MTDKDNLPLTCPFCNIQMISVINQDYPRLDTYLCFECGFHADTILIGQRVLYQAYQRLFPKFSDVMKLKHYSIKSNEDKK